jgi:SnoaL-like domain
VTTEARSDLASEHHARRYFELFNAHSREGLAELVHPDVVLELQAVEFGRVLRGRDELMAFFAEQWSRRRWDAVVHLIQAVEEDKAIVQGRVRWIDDEHVLRDDSRVWALQFRDGLLLRSIPAGSIAEAQARLSALSA